MLERTSGAGISEALHENAKRSAHERACERRYSDASNSPAIPAGVPDVDGEAALLDLATHFGAASSLYRELLLRTDAPGLA